MVNRGTNLAVTAQWLGVASFVASFGLFALFVTFLVTQSEDAVKSAAMVATLAYCGTSAATALFLIAAAFAGASKQELKRTIRWMILSSASFTLQAFCIYGWVKVTQLF